MAQQGKRSGGISAGTIIGGILCAAAAVAAIYFFGPEWFAEPLPGSSFPVTTMIQPDHSALTMHFTLAGIGGALVGGLLGNAVGTSKPAPTQHHTVVHHKEGQHKVKVCEPAKDNRRTVQTSRDAGHAYAAKREHDGKAGRTGDESLRKDFRQRLARERSHHHAEKSGLQA